MTYGYTFLKNAAERGDVLGAWHGRQVYARSKYDLINYDVNCFYVLYDDEDFKIYNNGYAYGELRSNGNIIEYGKPKVYHIVMKREGAKKEESSVVGDVALELSVEEVLKGARELTIDKLLEGFNYGLD